jgi:hypothetical protein
MWVIVTAIASATAVSIAALLASCGQPPAALVKQAEATPAATPQDFSAAQPLNPSSDADMAAAPTPTAIPTPSSALPTPQFQRPEAQAAFSAYLESYRQLMMPPPVPTTEVIDASQIQSSLETIRQSVLGVRQAEQNLKGILSPNELRAFKAYQNQLASPPAD